MKIANILLGLYLIASFALVACSTDGSTNDYLGPENGQYAGNTAWGYGGATASAGRTGNTFGAAGRATVGTAGSTQTATAGKDTTGAAGKKTTAGTGGKSATAGAGDAAGTGVAGSGAEAGNGNAGAAGQATAQIKGCGDAKLLAGAEDTSKAGPWPVGEITTKFGPFAAVDVMYPAKPGSETGKNQIKLDARTSLPNAEAKKVPDDEATIFEYGTYEDLPIDDANGPYPAVILVHGTASFRLASASTQARWASHGFIVMAADHPGFCLNDMIVNNTTALPLPPTNVTSGSDVDAEIAALKNPTNDLAFLAGHVDMNRIALSGHSGGAFYAGQWGSSKPNVQVIIELDGTSSPTKSSSLKSTLFVGGMDDKVLIYDGIASNGGGNLLYGPLTQLSAYNGSPVIKRILGIKGGGHLAPTNLCQPNSKGKLALDVSVEYGVSNVRALSSLNDCGTTAWDKGVEITSDITTAVLEETLHCQDRTAVISAIKSRHADVGDYRETLK
jgi:hypothetical protein